MQEEFLKKFIEEERYLQNPPLKTKDFIDFCKKRGIETNESELEFFEKEGLLYPIIRIDRPIGEEERVRFKKDGREFWRPAHFGLNEGEIELKRYKVKYYLSYGFSKEYNQYLLDWIEEGNLFDPSTKPFKKWSSFKGEKLDHESEKIISFYSSFQLHWLIIIKESYSFNFELSYDNIKVSSSLTYLNGFEMSGSFRIKSFKEFEVELEKVSISEDSKLIFNLENKKQVLVKMNQNFEKVLEFLLLIQSIFIPYGKSSSKTIQLRDENWYEKKDKFNSKNELKKLRITIKEIEALYYIFSRKTSKILGVKGDWIQLWKSLAWNKKDELEGYIRLGIEYLQWALMVKRFIEDYCGREILDIDEMSNISSNEILKYDPSEMDQNGILLRASRNLLYFDKKNKENHFHNTYKRLFYLANDFDIDYHHRLIVFVEGKTELTILPKFFEFFGNKPENLGIDIINIGGISKFFGPEIKVKNSSKKYDTVVLNNFLNLINYTLNKWQTLPFFIGDNENKIKKLLNDGISIEFDYSARKLPEKWYHTWDKDFELDNFTDKEIAIAINEVLDDQIESIEVEKIRNQEKGIKSIDKRIDQPKNKTKIADVLYHNLRDEYEKSKDENLLKRPIFDLIKKLHIMAIRNHPPSNTLVELKNKEVISKVIDKEI